MTDTPIPEAPRRLAEEDGDMAGLLRRAEPEFQHRLNESGAWGRIERTRRRRTVAAWGFSGAAMAAVIALVGLGATKLRADREDLVVHAEPVQPPENRAPQSVADPAVMIPPERVPTPAPPLPRIVAEPRDEAACRKLAAQAKYEAAIECFRSLSNGHGVKDEVALYEAARLTTDHVRDATRALAILDEHKQRFPNGALRGEMDMLRVQNLERAGRRDEALAASEALLASPVGRKLAPELHWLRGRMFENTDCVRAASEFVALVGEPGARGDEAELKRAQCLEKLGRSDDAASAYEQYLKRPSPARAAEAKARLSALR